MTCRAAVDNDILIKTSCYVLGDELLQLFAEIGGVRVLDSARYVVGDRLEKEVGIQDGERARLDWARILGRVEELHPTQEEVDLATDMEDYALKNSLPLDGGESLLCAMAIHRGMTRVVTGDKRAIESLETVVSESPLDLGELKDRIACFEQLLSAFVSSLGAEEVKSRVCSEPGVDRTASICFSCFSGDEAEFDSAGLEGYVAAMRAAAPSLLSIEPVG